MSRGVGHGLRRAALLRYLAGYAEAHGGAMPTLREMAVALNLRDKSSVIPVLRQLVAAGLITRAAGRERGITLLFVPVVPRAGDGAPLHFIPGAMLGVHALHHNGRIGQDHA